MIMSFCQKTHEDQEMSSANVFCFPTVSISFFPLTRKSLSCRLTALVAGCSNTAFMSHFKNDFDPKTKSSESSSWSSHLGQEVASLAVSHVSLLSQHPQE